jgi:ferric iron reductase protein FhuF
MLPGELLTNQDWLSERLGQLAAQSGCADRRTNATLWWYSASAVLLTPAVHALVLENELVSLTPSSLRFTLRWNGYPERVVAGPELGDGDPHALGRHLDDAFGPVITALARISDATERSLWAIAVDSLATRVLVDVPVTVRPAQVAVAVTDLAGDIAAASQHLRPLPRFVQIDGDPAGRQPPRSYVRRGSCCLLYRVPEGKCIACPAQAPDVRLERLLRHARATGPR